MFLYRPQNITPTRPILHNEFFPISFKVFIISIFFSSSFPLHLPYSFSPSFPVSYFTSQQASLSPLATHLQLGNPAASFPPTAAYPSLNTVSWRSVGPPQPAPSWDALRVSTQRRSIKLSTKPLTDSPFHSHMLRSLSSS